MLTRRAVLLQALPLPDEAAGFATLTQQQWAQLAPLVVTLLTLVWLTTYLLPAPRAKPACVCRRCASAGLHCAAMRPWRAVRWRRHVARHPPVAAAHAQFTWKMHLGDARAACARRPAQALQHAGEAGLRQGARMPPRETGCTRKQVDDADSHAVAPHQCVDNCNAIADIEDSGKKARPRRRRCARARRRSEPTRNTHRGAATRARCSAAAGSPRPSLTATAATWRCVRAWPLQRCCRS
jgi:hypothetical protein